MTLAAQPPQPTLALPAAMSRPTTGIAGFRMSDDSDPIALLDTACSFVVAADRRFSASHAHQVRHRRAQTHQSRIPALDLDRSADGREPSRRDRTGLDAIIGMYY